MLYLTEYMIIFAKFMIIMPKFYSSNNVNHGKFVITAYTVLKLNYGYYNKLIVS